MSRAKVRQLIGLVTGLCLCNISLADETTWEAGFSKVDITPAEPQRLSGYGNRNVPFAGIDEPLLIRGFALRQGTKGRVLVLLSIDTIGFPGILTTEIHEQVQARHGIDRSQFAICCTHSHTSPHITRGLSNLFATPLTEAEQQNGERYARLIVEKAQDAVDQAIADLQPARMYHGLGEAGFAQNRRVLKDGIWTGFGVNPDGVVDHTLPFLRITDRQGAKTRGILFNYACHCTTFGGEYNRVNGDWAGYAAKFLEQAHDGAVALCTIGTGADMNPHRDSARAFELAQSQGKEISDEINRLIAGKLTEITPDEEQPLASTFGYAGLPIDRPTKDQLTQSLKSDSPQTRQHAENMLAVLDRMGRLPETYPMPIQSWRIGNQFEMVFLGGEVCVDYGLRIKKEFAADGEAGTVKFSLPVWVNAYANDVFGYVAPERMRAEGGYEVDFSMIFYNQPGRWSTGTEEVILRRVHELVEDAHNQSRARSLDESVKTFSLAKGLVIEPVASEPLLGDPVNFHVGADGRLWVVEMSDYPRGEKSQASRVGNPGRETPWSGPPDGKIKVLTDLDGDGRYDIAQVFLDQLPFPTSVFPWRDGALICAAPDILFARDTDGDGVADQREVLYTGFGEWNPQHRSNGFAWGLDGWLYLASGASSNEITCLQTGERVNISGRDFRIHPATGRLEACSGRVQYGRCRDDFGNWFGNTNSEPLMHFPIEDRDLRRNPYVPSPSARVHVVDFNRTSEQHGHHVAESAIHPTSRTVDRFNDLFALDRFTSACGPLVIRNPLGTVIESEPPDSVLICEPVHNLVSRVVVQPDGVTFTGQRAASELESEFLSSSDQWFRPVRLMNAPDGTLWVCDMYRQYIEHPQWIPEAWQAQIDLYAGSDRGRIYRVRSEQQLPTPIRDFTALATGELVEAMNSLNAWQRDTCQQLILERGSIEPVHLARLAALTRNDIDPRIRVQAWWTLALMDQAAGVAADMLSADDARLVTNGLRAWGLRPLPNSPVQPAQLAKHDDVRVRFEVALAAADASGETRVNVLTRLARSDAADPWMRAAILSSSNGVAAELLAAVLSEVPDSPDRTLLVEGLIATALGDDADQGLESIARVIAPTDAVVQPWMLEGLAVCLDSLAARNLSLSTIAHRSSQERRQSLQRLTPLFAHARQLAQAVADDQADPTPELAAAIALLGHGTDRNSDEIELLNRLLLPSMPPVAQSAAVDALLELGEYSVLMTRLGEFTPALQMQVFATALNRPNSTEFLLKSLESRSLSASTLDATTRQALLTHRDARIRERASTLLSSVGMSSRDEIVTKYRTAIETGKLVGNSGRGRELFARRCASCHKINDLGQDLGAKLAALTNKSTDALLVAILDPNLAVEPKYFSYAIELADGRLQSGLILDENATSITLAAADGKQANLLRRDIAAMAASGKSFMPEGLDRDLPPQDVLDVITFVQQSK